MPSEVNFVGSLVNFTGEETESQKASSFTQAHKASEQVAQGLKPRSLA